MVEYTVRFPHLASMFQVTDFRHIFKGVSKVSKEDGYFPCELQKRLPLPVGDDLAAQLCSRLLDPDLWPLDLRFQSRDLAADEIGLRTDLCLAYALNEVENCSIDRLIGFVRSLKQLSDEQLITACCYWVDSPIDKLDSHGQRLRSVLRETGCSNPVRGYLAISRHCAVRAPNDRFLVQPSSHTASFLLFGQFDWDPAVPDSIGPRGLGEIIGGAFRAHGLYKGEMLQDLSPVCKLGAAFLGRQRMLLDFRSPQMPATARADELMAIRVCFLDGLIPTLVAEYGPDDAVGCLGALLFDDEGEWFPSEVLAILIRQSKPFQDLFKTYENVARFLKWHGFASGELNQFGPDPSTNALFLVPRTVLFEHETMLLGYGEIALLSKAAIRLTRNDPGSRETTQFGPRGARVWHSLVEMQPAGAG